MRAHRTAGNTAPPQQNETVTAKSYRQVVNLSQTSDGRGADIRRDQRLPLRVRSGIPRARRSTAETVRATGTRSGQDAQGNPDHRVHRTAVGCTEREEKRVADGGTTTAPETQGHGTDSTTTTEPAASAGHGPATTTADSSRGRARTHPGGAALLGTCSTAVQGPIRRFALAYPL